MPTTDELQQQIDALIQRVNAITAPPTDYYVHRYSGEEIDNAVAKISGSTGLVSSFNGRTGAVMPAAGDYTAAMVEAAPSGFGLGSDVPKSVSSWDAALENGFYGAPAPSDVGSGTLWGFTTSLVASYKYQQIFSDSYEASVCRYMINGTWQPFEWINPPMFLGVEYRTTERYNGKPVYVNTVNCGAAVDGAKSVAHGTANVGSIVSATPQDNTVPGCGPYNDGANALFATADSTNITVYAKGSYVGHTVVAVIKYTKTTD